MNIRLLTLDNPKEDIAYLDSVISLHEKSTATNSTPYLYPQNRDFFENNLKGATINLLALNGDHVVGYCALRKMTPWPEYLSLEQYIPEECALMLFNLVDPDFRGLGIGKQLSLQRIVVAKKAGFRHLFVTVHPENVPSVSILEKLGFTLIAQKRMFTTKLMRKLMYLYIGD